MQFYPEKSLFSVSGVEEPIYNIFNYERERVTGLRISGVFVREFRQQKTPVTL